MCGFLYVTFFGIHYSTSVGYLRKTINCKWCSRESSNFCKCFAAKKRTNVQILLIKHTETENKLWTTMDRKKRKHKTHKNEPNQIGTHAFT